MLRKQAKEWTDRKEAAQRHGAGLGDHVLLGDAALDEAVRKLGPERHQARVQRQVAVKRDEVGAAPARVDQRPPVRVDQPLRGGRRRGQVDFDLLQAHRGGSELLQAGGEAREQLCEAAGVLLRAGAPEWKP